MIDIHTHILPGLDDGPEDWEETIEMCRIARDEGTEILVATPHFLDGRYPITKEIISQKVQELRDRIRGKIEIRILWGADVHFTADLVEKIKEGIIPTINGSNYLLLELPFFLLPPNIEKLLFNLKLIEITPILTHVERYPWIKDIAPRLPQFIKLGAITQITAMSLTGKFGKKAKYWAIKLLMADLVHIVASDAHSLRSRPPGLSAALEVARTLVGDKALMMFKENPEKVIHGVGLDL